MDTIKKKSFKGQKADLTVVMVTQSLLATVGFGGFSVTPCGRDLQDWAHIIHFLSALLQMVITSHDSS